MFLLNGYMHLSGRATRSSRRQAIGFGVLFVVFGVLNLILLVE